MQRRGPGETRAGLRHRLHHHGRFGDAETRAAVGLRDGDAEPALLGESAVEIVGEGTFAIPRQPVFVGEARANLFDCRTDRLLFSREGKLHGSSCSSRSRNCSAFGTGPLRQPAAF
jgi:hypothetical protein